MNNIELNDFVLPIVIQNDYKYAQVLEETLNDFLSAIHGRQHISDTIYQQTVRNKEKILEAINHYQNADISSAKSCIHDILNDYVHDPFIVAQLNDSTAFRGLTRFSSSVPEAIPHPISYSAIRMFKARLGVGNFDRSDFLHIPFNKRGIVSTQRFSIAGVPCMYFGITSYVCWLELGKPSDSGFNVSAYDLPGNMRVLNLAIPQMLLNGLSNRDEYIQPVLSMIQLFPLVIATSFKVIESNRSFRIEYIISQLIMQCLTSFNIDGVAYISKQVKNDSSNYPYCINFAVPMKSNSDKLFSDFAENLPLTNPINFAEYKQLINPNVLAQGHAMSFGTLFENHPLTYMGKRIRYDNLLFSKLDDFLYNETFEVVSNNPSYS
ncbi:hypothetical protein PAEAM_56300 [Paenibacillus sp. GM1FR]|uniref:RES domain-containing protein n=1 Tax=Paenibacillus sp. GM1FR TaxID=2059267 RepID=UPI000CBAADE3|nr:RES domain-containing protein [Paenibacillus sp. GM1FR]PJN50018.1 hypothetical protein PAEAM_56300 [Paenibacillus sp. GM1FR]